MEAMRGAMTLADVQKIENQLTTGSLSKTPVSQTKPKPVSALDKLKGTKTVTAVAKRPIYIDPLTTSSKTRTTTDKGEPIPAPNGVNSSEEANDNSKKIIIAALLLVVIVIVFMVIRKRRKNAKAK